MIILFVQAWNDWIRPILCILVSIQSSIYRELMLFVRNLYFYPKVVFLTPSFVPKLVNSMEVESETTQNDWIGSYYAVRDV